MARYRWSRRIGQGGGTFAAALAVVAAALGQQKPPDLTNASIEDLMNIEVTSASKKEQKLSEVPAAVFVITQEDIRRSGATSIPDLLRMVPGMDVAQINANTWAISSRGFNLQFANKLLVLVDGRAVYTPLFGGVYWDTQDVPLEDIERIEVTRGPGGTVWGANAVNGVIDIITKKASETKGVLAVVGGGTQALEFGTLQYGGTLGSQTNFRLFTKYQNDNNLEDSSEQSGEDAWHQLHGGFRADTEFSNKDKLTVEGDVITESAGAIIVHSDLSLPGNVNQQKIANVSAGDVLGRWDHVFSDKVDTTLQVYFDRYRRDGPESTEGRNTFDFDFQNHMAIGRRQDLIWGADYRHTSADTIGTIDQAFLPASIAEQLFSAFVQDQITLKPEKLNLYLGTKVENNYFSGFDAEPSGRLAWTPSKQHTVWAAVSRAERAPTQRDKDLSAVLAALPGPTEVILLGNANFKSEHLLAYELGYRGQPSAHLTLAIATFFNSYNDLTSIEPQPSFIAPNSTTPLLVEPRVLENGLHGNTDGVEASASWQVTSRWTVSPGYSLLQMHLHDNATSRDGVSVADTQGSSPTHQAQLRSRWTISKNLDWDVNAYFVDRLPAASIPSYTRLDTQLSWRPGKTVQLSVVGQNLLQNLHYEFNDFLQSVNSSQIKRSAYGKITWSF
jgi:iron complex outermembrane receptor protein